MNARRAPARAAASRRPRNALRRPAQALRAVRTLAHVVVGIATTTAVFPFVTPARRRRLTQRWSGRLLALLNVECRVRGDLAAHGGNVLIVANHVSWLDIVVLNALCPARFVAKAELAR